MSKLVNNEIFDVVEKLHKAGLSDAVAIEVIRHNRDYDLSKLATAEQVNNLEGRIGNLEVRFDALEDRIGNLEVRFNVLETEVRNLKENMVTKLEFAEFKADVDVKLACLRTEIATSSSTTMKWFIGLFATQIVSFVGIILASLLK